MILFSSRQILHHHKWGRTTRSPFVRCLSSDTTRSQRSVWEEGHHLGRALAPSDTSTRSIDPDQQKQWEYQMRRQRRRSWDMKHFFGSHLQRPPPPYESKALADIHATSSGGLGGRQAVTNVLLEIRDARVPAASHHPSVTRLATHHRVHLICYTHADLLDVAARNRVETWTMQSWPESRCFFVDAREHRPFYKKSSTSADLDSAEEETKNEVDLEYCEHDPGQQQSQDRPYDLLYDELLHHLDETGGRNVALTVGVANTGKSSVLWALLRTARERGDRGRSVRIGRDRSKKAAIPEIRDRPGITRHVTEYVLRDKPRVYFLDVPGLTPPPVYFDERPEAWFGLAAANLLALPYELRVDVNCQTALCDYVLYCMNRDNNFTYVSRVAGLEGPTDDILQVLPGLKYSYREQQFQQHHQDITAEEQRLAQCETFLKLFNNGNFGPVVLDDMRTRFRKFIFHARHFPNNDRQSQQNWNRGRNDSTVVARAGRRFMGKKVDGFLDDDFQYKQ